MVEDLHQIDDSCKSKPPNILKENEISEAQKNYIAHEKENIGVNSNEIFTPVKHDNIAITGIRSGGCEEKVSISSIPTSATNDFIKDLLNLCGDLKSFERSEKGTSLTICSS